MEVLAINDTNLAGSGVAMINGRDPGNPVYFGVDQAFVTAQPGNNYAFDLQYGKQTDTLLYEGFQQGYSYE